MQHTESANVTMVIKLTRQSNNIARRLHVRAPALECIALSGNEIIEAYHMNVHCVHGHLCWIFNAPLIRLAGDPIRPRCDPALEQDTDKEARKRHVDHVVLNLIIRAVLVNKHSGNIFSTWLYLFSRRALVKTVGDTVIGGTLNTTGMLVVRAAAVGADTVLALRPRPTWMNRKQMPT